MPRDVAGIQRTGVFQTLHDPASGLTFTPTGGTAQRYTYRVAGPGASGTITASSCADPRHLTYVAYEQGAAKPPATDSLPSLAGRHW